MSFHSLEDQTHSNQSGTITKEEIMSMMCSMQGCTQKQGMCGHEKMMLVMMVIGMIGGGAYWLLG